MLPQYLVRARAWWFNKVPLSVTLALLLVDGASLSFHAALAVVLIVLTVCAVGNYSYGMNDLYDVEEDARAGRHNAAVALGTPRVRQIVIASAIATEMLATLAAGAWGAGLTIIELLLPLLTPSRPQNQRTQMARHRRRRPCRACLSRSPRLVDRKVF